ncbi:MAG: DNA/RNA nuclease SfsA [Anaerolineae bacterium]
MLYSLLQEIARAPAHSPPVHSGPKSTPHLVFTFLTGPKAVESNHNSGSDTINGGILKLPPLLRGAFVTRHNRFLATVSVDGQEVKTHVPSPGRMYELLTPERDVWITRVDKPTRKTSYDLVLVRHNSQLVSVDSRLPNALFREALDDDLPLGAGYDVVEQEVIRDHSRLDFCLRGSEGTLWVEVKSVNLVEDGLALFPDAPTARGRRHLETLAAIAASGDRAAAAFVVQRSDAVAFAPHEEMDPAFADILYRVARSGVTVRAYTCHVELEEIRIAGRIPFHKQR